MHLYCHFLQHKSPMHSPSLHTQALLLLVVPNCQQYNQICPPVKIHSLFHIKDCEPSRPSNTREAPTVTSSPHSDTQRSTLHLSGRTERRRKNTLQMGTFLVVRMIYLGVTDVGL